MMQLLTGSVVKAGQMQDGPSTAEFAFANLLLRREQDIFTLPARLAQADGVIGPADRDRQAAWICSAARRLGLDMDSTTTAISIMDKVVCSTRVPPRYINCVAAASLHIAKKIWEDCDDSTYVFLQRLRLEYTISEMKRMEIRILELLRWDIQLPTVSRFLDAILSPLGATYLISPLRRQIEIVVCNWRLVSVFRPSTIALAVVSLLLEGTRRNWVQSSHHLLKSLNIDICELVRCRENISSMWHPSLFPTFSTYGLLAANDETNPQQQPAINQTSPRCSYSTPGVTPHPSNEITSPPQQPQPTPC